MKNKSEAKFLINQGILFRWKDCCIQFFKIKNTPFALDSLFIKNIALSINIGFSGKRFLVFLNFLDLIVVFLRNCEPVRTIICMIDHEIFWVRIPNVYATLSDTALETF